MDNTNESVTRPTKEIASNIYTRLTRVLNERTWTKCSGDIKADFDERKFYTKLFDTCFDDSTDVFKIPKTSFLNILILLGVEADVEEEHLTNSETGKYELITRDEILDARLEEMIRLINASCYLFERVHIDGSSTMEMARIRRALIIAAANMYEARYSNRGMYEFGYYLFLLMDDRLCAAVKIEEYNTHVWKRRFLRFIGDLKVSLDPLLEKNEELVLSVANLVVIMKKFHCTDISSDDRSIVVPPIYSIECGIGNHHDLEAFNTIFFSNFN